jgi:methylated-DNA-[protein]-cysteine S-methyltransferase
MLIIPTLLGDMEASFDTDGLLTKLLFVGLPTKPVFAPPSELKGGAMSRAQNIAAELLKSEINGYFSGALKTFSVPIAPSGTPFQMRVWRSLLNVPYGETSTYGQIAKGLGNAKLSRAVGMANGTNPIWIIIPCHRVIGAGGKLTGYAGGLWRKAELLKLESGTLGSGEIINVYKS